MKSTGRLEKTMWYVYGKEGCTYCKKAVDLLEQMGQKVSYIDMKDVENTAGWKTVPQIFTEKHHIGGYAELEKHFFGKAGE